MEYLWALTIFTITHSEQATPVSTNWALFLEKQQCETVALALQDYYEGWEDQIAFTCLPHEKSG